MFGSVRKAFGTASRGIQKFGSKIDTGLDKFGRKVQGLEKRAIGGLASGVNRAVGAVGSAERILDTGLKTVNPMLSSVRQGLNIASNIAGAVPGGQGLSSALASGAMGVNQAKMMAHQLKQMDLKGTARKMADIGMARGLEKYNERKKELMNQQYNNPMSKFV